MFRVFFRNKNQNRYVYLWGTFLQGENDGIWASARFTQLFIYLPLEALIDKKIICRHGCIVRSLYPVEQIEKLERLITMDAGSPVFIDFLWSDPQKMIMRKVWCTMSEGLALSPFGSSELLIRARTSKIAVSGSGNLNRVRQ